MYCLTGESRPVSDHALKTEALYKQAEITE